MDEPGPEVRQDEAGGRFEIVVDGRVAGYSEYHDRPGVRVFTHTEIDPVYEGRGLGGRLARGGLDATRAAGLRVEPECEFIAAYIERHQEYADLVAQPPRH